VLLTSFALCDTAVRAVRDRCRRVQQAAIGFAMSAELAFLLDKVLEWKELVAPPAHGAHREQLILYFFVLNGLHDFNVLIGMGILNALLRLSSKPSLSKGQFDFVEGGACLLAT